MLGTIWLLYLVAGNLFLNTPLGQRTVNLRENRFHAEWAWAATLWPGHITARDITVGGHAQHNVWAVHAQWAHGQIALLPLLWKELRFPWVSAATVAVEVDRVDPRMPSTPPDGSRPWTLRFDEIATDSLAGFRYRELQVTGDGAATFGMEKVLRGGTLEILPSRVDMQRVRVAWDDMTLLDDARIAGRYAVAPVRREAAQGADRLALLDAALQLRARTPTLSLRAARDGLRMDAADAQGEVEADLRLEQGLLVPGGTLSWHGPVQTRVDGRVRDDTLAIAAEVADEGIDVGAHLGAPGNDGGRLDAELRLAGRRLFAMEETRWIDRVSGRVDMDWHFASLAWLSDLLARGDWLRLDGAARLIAALRIQGGLLAAGSRVEIPEVEATAGLLDNRISGRARLEGEVVEGDIDRDAHVDAVLERFRIAAGDAPDKPYLEGRDLHIALRGAADLGRFADTLAARVDFEGAEIPDLTAYNRYLPADTLRFTRGSGHLDGEFELDMRGDVGQGRLAISGSAAGLDLAGTAFQADIAVDSHLQGLDGETRRFSLDGSSVRLDNVVLAGADPDAQPWWGRIDLPEARVDWNRPLTVEGDAHLAMRNVGLLLALFAERSDFPGWVASILDAGRTEATGQLRLHDDSLVLDDVHASNERFDLDARVRIDGGVSRGDLYLRWGVLGLGLELDAGERDFHLLNAREWYQGRPELLPDG